MRALKAVLLVCASTIPGHAGDDAIVSLPSGLQAHLQEMLWDRPGGGLVYRFRFVAPDFTGDETFEVQTIDLEYLCNEYALARIADIGPEPSRIIVSLADRPSEFGQFDPDVAQVFESFSMAGDACIWEMH